jgi:hypothetical protein
MPKVLKARIRDAIFCAKWRGQKVAFCWPLLFARKVWHQQVWPKAKSQERIATVNYLVSKIMPVSLTRSRPYKQKFGAAPHNVFLCRILRWGLQHFLRAGLGWVLRPELGIGCGDGS